MMSHSKVGVRMLCTALALTPLLVALILFTAAWQASASPAGLQSMTDTIQRGDAHMQLSLNLLHVAAR